jgi:superoxide reductase
MKRILSTLVVAAAVMAAAYAQPMAASVSDIYQTDEWATEKHVPVIDAPDVFVPGEMTTVFVEVGKEIEHPNTTEHHIRWIRVYFMPEGSSYAYEIGDFDLGAHGEGVDGPNTSTIYTNHKVMLEFKTDVPGTLYATSFCNIHGMWESSKAISIAQ